MNGIMGGFYRLCEWIMRISVINVLWALCSFPIFLIALQLLLAENFEQISALLFAIGVISPFIFFPATAAMFSVARKWVLGDTDVPLFKTFFVSYKKNYLQSMIGGIVYMVLAGLIVVNYRFYSGLESQFSLISGFFIAFFIIMFISIINFFNLLVHLHMKSFQLVKNSIFLTVGRPLTTLMIIISSVAVIYISINYLNFFLFFVAAGSVIAYLSFMYFNRAFEKIQDKRDEISQAEAEAKKEAGIEEEDTKTTNN